VWLGTGKRNQRLDLAGFQFGHRFAAGKTGIGQHRPRQADRMFHHQDDGCEGGLITKQTACEWAMEWIVCLG